MALELAAARTRALSVEEIDIRLKDRFRLLTGGSRTALPRQQTLRALMDWSYDLLGPQERLLLNRLSVFAGRWTLTTAEQIVIGESPQGDFIEDWEILDLLTSLLDKSLVIAETQSDVSRYYLLQTVRQYALEKLLASGEESRVRRRHCDTYVALAVDAALKLEGPEQQFALDTLEREHDNLREALVWCHGRAEAVEIELRLIGLLAPFWMRRGHRTEGRERTAAVTSDNMEQTPAYAKILYFAGAFAYYLGNHSEAIVCYDRALAIQTAPGDQAGEATTLSGRGTIALQQGDFARARTCFERARRLHQALGNVSAEATVLNNLGLLLVDEGDLTEARVCFEAALAHFRTLGNRAWETATLTNLGVVAADLNDYRTAHTYYEQALAATRELGNWPDEATTLYNLGYVSRHEGNIPVARAYEEQALALGRELGDRKLEALCLQELGKIAVLAGDYMAARSLQRQALTTFDQLGHVKGTIDSLEGFATLAAAQEGTTAAAQLLGAAEALRENLRAPLPPNERQSYDVARSELRAILGEPGFAEFRASGHSLTLEEAIAFALAEFPEELFS